MIECPIPLLGVCGFSGSGKTTLLAGLIPLLKARGLRLALLKHAHHSFDIDQPGKDSYELRRAGADQVIVASRHRLAMVKECRDAAREPRIGDLIPCIDTRELDLILVEGFKREPIPKIEVCRPSLGLPAIHEHDPNVIAVACDTRDLASARDLPLLDLNDPRTVCDFISDWMTRGGSVAISV